VFSDGVRDGAIRSAGRPRWVPQVLPVMLALLLELSVATGCRPTPQVPATNFVYSAALLTAANTKSQNRLQAVRQLIDRDHTAGLIGAEEYATYGTILRAAEAGQWVQAEQAVLQFRRDQIR
jgi:hypothetical protein